MFDIHFADPTRETVGQRKTRKESQVSANGLSRVSSLRSSKSSESTQSHGRSGLLSLFGGGNSKKTLPRTGSQSKLSNLRSGEVAKSSRRISSYTVTTDAGTHDDTDAKGIIPLKNVAASSTLDGDTGSSNQSEAAESIFSGWTARSSITDSSWGSVINSPTNKFQFNQAFGSTTLSPRCPDIPVSPRDSVIPIRTMPIEVETADSPTDPKRGSTTFEFPVPNSLVPQESLLVSAPILVQETRSIPTPQRSPVPQHSWTPPGGWEYSLYGELRKVTVPKLQNPPTRSALDKRQKPLRMVHSNTQKSIRRMEAASSKIILERLKEQWIEVADASIYRELELEKQRWMLFALRDLKTTRLSGCEDVRTIQVSTSGATKVLSLYENHASASFLSALSDPITEVHHIHSKPLSQKSYPNTRPLAMQEYAVDLPYSSNSFSSIHAFSLPTLFPASSIPGILKECYRLLDSQPKTAIPAALQSTLHLTIIDPAPLTASLGPILRTWLDNHLMFNLEKQFRCINPSRLFPSWLQEVGLRAEGSMILTVPFLASVNAEEAGLILAESNHDDQITTAGMVDKTGIVKQELKSVVGRMLWQETWGPLVQAQRWWWEEPDIIEECQRLRTCWEYSVIDAVRGDI